MELPEGIFNLEVVLGKKTLLVFSVKVTGWLISVNTLKKKRTESLLLADHSNNKMVPFRLVRGLREWISKFWASRMQK